MIPAVDITPDEEAWTAVGSYHDVATAHEHALVVLAMGRPCWIMAQPDHSIHHLLVMAGDSTQAKRELEEYESELAQQLAKPVAEPGSFAHSPGWVFYLLWVIILALMHRLQQLHPEITEWAASSSTGLIDDKEWWRPFTALFLHADMEHLLGNLLSGLFFATLVASSIGAWRGWLLILTCGTFGNALTSVLVHPEAYRSIGASTAVFSALGILSGLGLAWMLRFRSQIPWLRVAAPVIGGIVVLGMTGSGVPEGNTDVMGHVFGFVAGVVAGAIAGCRLSYKASSGTSTAESDART